MEQRNLAVRLFTARCSRIPIQRGIKLFASTVIGLSLMVVAPTNAAEGNPKWCQKNYVCLTLGEAADLAVKQIELSRDLKLAKAKVRRFGGVIGCGPGIGFQVESNEVTLDGQMLQCGFYFGIRIP